MANILYAGQTAEYFSQAVDKPWIVTQDRLDELQEHMGASGSNDFSLESYLGANGEIIKVGRLFSLPFRLSLGIHESVEPIVNPEATLTIHGVYKSTLPMDPKPDGFRLDLQKMQRAESAIVGALIQAADDRGFADLIGPAMKFARKKKLITLPGSANLKSALTLFRKS